eukprot:1847707-Prymnesium_polylepis.1
MHARAHTHQSPVSRREPDTGRGEPAHRTEYRNLILPSTQQVHPQSQTSELAHPNKRMVLGCFLSRIRDRDPGSCHCAHGRYRWIRTGRHNASVIN